MIFHWLSTLHSPFWFTIDNYSEVWEEGGFIVKLLPAAWWYRSPRGKLDLHHSQQTQAVVFVARVC